LSQVLPDFIKQTELEDNTNQKTMSGRYLVLSLFILLLAFFILLNAISNRTEIKSRVVMDSLLSTFRTTEASGHSAKKYAPFLGAIREPEDLLEEMRYLWVNAIPIAEFKLLTDGKSLQFRLPANMVFAGGVALIRKDRFDLIRNVATVLGTEVSGFSSELELLVGADWRAGKEFNLRKNNLVIQRAVEFAEKLISSGAPRASVSIGVHERGGKEFELRFFVRSNALAKTDFQEYSE
tara:strand:- start:74688 stop:75398 length:711 start_codon:yes stop_codon:yes gene_type:complete